jgi:hypothetical protein
MNVGTGEVLFDTKKSHKATDVLAFFKFIELHVPKHLDVHVVLDSLSAHKAPLWPSAWRTPSVPVGTWTSHRLRRRG